MNGAPQVILKSGDAGYDTTVKIAATLVGLLFLGVLGFVLWFYLFRSKCTGDIPSCPTGTSLRCDEKSRQYVCLCGDVICPEGYECQNGECVPASSGECTGSPKACVEGSVLTCQSGNYLCLCGSTECNGNEICSDGTCTPTDCPNERIECPAGFEISCADGEWECLCGGVPCADGEVCVGQVCQSTAGTCGDEPLPDLCECKDGQIICPGCDNSDTTLECFPFSENYVMFALGNYKTNFEYETSVYSGVLFVYTFKTGSWNIPAQTGYCSATTETYPGPENKGLDGNEADSYGQMLAWPLFKFGTNVTNVTKTGNAMYSLAYDNENKDVYLGSAIYRNRDNCNYYGNNQWGDTSFQNTSKLYKYNIGQGNQTVSNIDSPPNVGTRLGEESGHIKQMVQGVTYSGENSIFLAGTMTGRIQQYQVRAASLVNLDPGRDPESIAFMDTVLYASFSGLTASNLVKSNQLDGSGWRSINLTYTGQTAPSAVYGMSGSGGMLYASSDVGIHVYNEFSKNWTTLFNFADLVGVNNAPLASTSSAPSFVAYDAPNSVVYFVAIDQNDAYQAFAYDLNKSSSPRGIGYFSNPTISEFDIVSNIRAGDYNTSGQSRLYVTGYFRSVNTAVGQGLDCHGMVFYESNTESWVSLFKDDDMENFGSGNSNEDTAWLINTGGIKRDGGCYFYEYNLAGFADVLVTKISPEDANAVTEFMLPVCSGYSFSSVSPCSCCIQTSGREKPYDC